MKLSDFDYNLPQHLIAQFPTKQRGASRLLLLRKESLDIIHYNFNQLCTLLDEGDILVLNDTRVLNARLVGKRFGFQGKIEVLLIDRISNRDYKCLVKPARRFKDGTKLIFDNGRLEAEVLGSEEEFKHIRFNISGDIATILDEVGQIPLPPYIKREPEEQDKNRYQTIYASKKGAVAAPTAGLHFTEDILSGIKSRGVEIAYITLHVGYATFKPVTEDKVSLHKMHKEYFEIPKVTSEMINRTKERGKRVIAVGTTTCRALESAAGSRQTGLPKRVPGAISIAKGWTDLFIYPGYNFKIVDGMLTNFHFPRTTLLMLVSALCGRDNLIKAYHEAIEKGYRFYSYGDAMLIV